MPYTTPTPSTVSAGDTFPASAYNIISADLQDHETRIKTGVESYTTAQKNALVGVTTGTMVFDSTLGRIQVWNGSAWMENFPVAAGFGSATVAPTRTTSGFFTFPSPGFASVSTIYKATDTTGWFFPIAGIYQVSFNYTLNLNFTAGTVVDAWFTTLESFGQNPTLVSSIPYFYPGLTGVTNRFVGCSVVKTFFITPAAVAASAKVRVSVDAQANSGGTLTSFSAEMNNFSLVRLSDWA